MELTLQWEKTDNFFKKQWFLTKPDYDKDDELKKKKNQRERDRWCNNYLRREGYFS